MELDTILQGDCIQVLKAFPARYVDVIFADPPYNLQLKKALLRPNHSLVAAVKDEWDHFTSFAQYDAFTRAWLGACRRVLKDTGTIWVVGTYHNIFRVGNVLMDLGYWILNDFLYEKINPMPNFRGRRFTNATETLIWAKKSVSQRKYIFNYDAMKHLNDDKQMSNVWRLPICTGPERIKINGKKAHPTQKPEALLYRVLLASTMPGDVVLDPFFGTGTTGAVARKLHRHFIGIERDPAYVAIAQQRLDHIAAIPLDDAIFTTPSRQLMPRVAFGRIIEAGYIQPGQQLFSQDCRHVAIVKADSHLICGDLAGSIHKVASLLVGKGNQNGWDFWHILNADGTLTPLDEVRERYRQQTSGR